MGGIFILTKKAQSESTRGGELDRLARYKIIEKMMPSYPVVI